MTYRFFELSYKRIVGILYSDEDKLDEILDLRSKGLRSAVMLPIGYRDAQNDWLVDLVKVRKSTEDLVTVLD